MANTTEDKLRTLMGYISNGTDTTVKLYQDDATRDYIVTVGNKWYHGKSLNEAIDHAYTDTVNRGELS